MKNKNIVFFGPRLVSVFGKTTVGGGTILFENLIKEYNKNIININGDSDWVIKKIVFNIFILLKYAFMRSGQNIIFVAHRQAILFLMIDFLFRKKSTYRLIGANFDFWFSNQLVQKLIKINSKTLGFSVNQKTLNFSIIYVLRLQSRKILEQQRKNQLK